MPLDWRLRLLLLADTPSAQTQTPDEARRQFSVTLRRLRPIASGAGPRMANEVLFTIDHFRARLYTPTTAAATSPLVIQFHGGGWVVGDFESHAPSCRFIAHASRARVLAVDYRRAPEHPFPAPLEDCFKALAWASEKNRPGIDSSRIALLGDSAGANLAIAAALLARERQALAPVKALCLLYPIADHDFSTPSYLRYADGYMLTRARMQWYWHQYLQDPAARAQPLASPLRADLRGLPNTLLVTAEYDVLHDEGVALGRALQQAGVPTQLLDVPGVIHGFIELPRLLRTTRHTLSTIAGHLRAALGILA